LEQERESRKLKYNVDATVLSGAVKQYIIPTRYNPDGSISLPTQAVYGIDPNHSPIDAYMATRTVPGGLIVNSIVTSGAIGVSKTVYTVPTGKRARPTNLVSDITASATVGNRVLVARVLDPNANVIWIGSSSGAVTAAQIGGYDIGFGMPGTPSTTVRRNIANTANTNVQVRELSGITDLLAGSTINIMDVTAVDVADLIVCRTSVIEYDG